MQKLIEGHHALTNSNGKGKGNKGNSNSRHRARQKSGRRVQGGDARMGMREREERI